MAKVTEVVKEIAQTWQKLGKEDRQKYKEAAKRGKYSNSNIARKFLNKAMSIINNSILNRQGKI